MNRVLVVDDEKSIRLTLCEFLTRAGFEADAAGEVESACRMVAEKEYDVIITDVIMPKISGMQLLERIREKSQTTQVIIMTGEPTVETAITAVHNGANDYLIKPINKNALLKAVNHAVQVKKLSDDKKAVERQRQIYQKELEDMVAVKTTALQNAMQSIISLLATVVETRDPYTAGHQRRVGNLSAAIAAKMKMEPRTIELIRICGYIHDLGKIAVPAEILSKPGHLSGPEIQMVMDHPFRGYEMLTKVDLPEQIGETIYQHHERCDGSGYPRGLTSDEIRMEAQVLMVADVVEAMISHRPYRPALGLYYAINEIQNHSGVLYNPEVVTACTDLFLNDQYNIDDQEHIFFPL